MPAIDKFSVIKQDIQLQMDAAKTDDERADIAYEILYARANVPQEVIDWFKGKFLDAEPVCPMCSIRR